MADPASASSELLTIGQLAGAAGIATSAVRYYEQRDLIRPDRRINGQRRFEATALRRLTFIMMLQDAGLSLDDIHGILHAPDNASWKAIAADRLESLDEVIAALSHARNVLEATLLCRFDHPLDECSHMNAEIDRRLLNPDRSWGDPDETG